jgi:hypothetical protein
MQPPTNGPITKEQTMLESIKDAVDSALTDPTSTSIDWVHTTAELVEGVEVVLAVATAGGAGGAVATLAEVLEGVGSGVAWPATVGVAAMAGEFAAIGAGYAEAARQVKADRSAAGFSEGVVMGALKEKVDFIKSRFFEWSAEQNDFFPEAGALAQHYYNAALALGYQNGNDLNPDEGKLFWTDMARGLAEPLGYPDAATTDDERERAWVDFYIAAGAQFAKLHIGQ